MVILRSFFRACSAEAKIFVRMTVTAPKQRTMRRLSVRYPMPFASPAAMAANTLVISLELPGMDRNRTSENAPATATPVPTLPFTSMITACTSMGSRISVIRKFKVE